jgi:hypothetical protein
MERMVTAGNITAAKAGVRGRFGSGWLGMARAFGNGERPGCIVRRRGCFVRGAGGDTRALRFVSLELDVEESTLRSPRLVGRAAGRLAGREEAKNIRGSWSRNHLHARVWPYTAEEKAS